MSSSNYSQYGSIQNNPSQSNGSGASVDNINNLFSPQINQNIGSYDSAGRPIYLNQLEKQKNDLTAFANQVQDPQGIKGFMANQRMSQDPRLMGRQMQSKEELLKIAQAMQIRPQDRYKYNGSNVFLNNVKGDGSINNSPEFDYNWSPILGNRPNQHMRTINQQEYQKQNFAQPQNNWGGFQMPNQGIPIQQIKKNWGGFQMQQAQMQQPQAQMQQPQAQMQQPQNNWGGFQMQQPQQGQMQQPQYTVKPKIM